MAQPHCKGDGGENVRLKTKENTEILNETEI
jgi:hypothetical protein